MLSAGRILDHNTLLILRVDVRTSDMIVEKTQVLYIHKETRC